MESAMAEASVWPRPAKLALAALAIAGSVGLLIAASRAPEPEYYEQVDEVAAIPDVWRGSTCKSTAGWFPDQSSERALRCWSRERSPATTFSTPFRTAS